MSDNTAAAAEAAAAENARLSFPGVRELLEFMHVDTDDPAVDRIVDEFWPAAKEYLYGSGIRPTPGNYTLFDLAVHSLTLHYYDHRDSTGGEAPLPTGLRPIINQLKHSSEGCL